MKDRAEREEALARLAAPLLRRDSEALSEACPGADIVAGYLDHSLDATERSRCEEHFAACARCQGVLAGLARIEAPAPQRRPAESPASNWPWVLNWRWLAPAAAVLAVGVTWTLVRQNLEPSVPVGSMATPSATVADKAAAAVEAEARKDEQPPAPAKKADRRADEIQLTRQAASSKLAPASVAGGESKREAPAAPAPLMAQNVAAEEAKVAAAEAAAAEKAAGAGKPVAMAPPAEPPVVEPQAGARRAPPTRVMATAGASLPATLVASPAPAVSWRIGPAGSIERSVDARRSWERQDSGVRAALLAGSAPAETICWVVGLGGTIIRTTDGRTWQIVSPPVPVDFVSVSALDGLVATVVAVDGRQFTTTDGGRTWRVP